MPIPSTLQGLLTERLDRLSGLRELIDQAAVLGREFDRRLLRALVPLDANGFRGAVAQLTGHEVLRVVEGYESRLEFSHALLQEAAYERILRQRRRECTPASPTRSQGDHRPPAKRRRS